MRDRLQEHLWTVIGSVIIASGSAMAGLYSFEEEVLMVMLGFLIFIAGYRVSQVGTHAERDRVVSQEILQPDGSITLSTLTRGFLLILGWVGIAFGVTIFSRTILHPSFTNAVISGISSISGYMAAHVGINGVGLGDSVFGPILDRLLGNKRDNGNEE